MTLSNTSRLTAILSTIAVTIIIGIMACPSRSGSNSSNGMLLSVEVTAPSSTVALGTTQQLTAVGNYSGGTTADLTALAQWSSSDEAVGTVSTDVSSRGLVSGLGLGSTTITANFKGMSGTLTLAVSRVLASIEVTPTNPQIALGTSEQFAATGTYVDGTTADLTTQVQWESSGEGASTISNVAGSQGLAQSVGLGDTTITATLEGRSGSTTMTVSNAMLLTVEVTPTNPAIALGTSQQFVATGAFSDGTTQDLSMEVVWSSSDASAQISNLPGTQGLTNSVAVGSATISATLAGVTGATTLTISDATLSSIEVTPSLPEIALGGTQAFAATGIFTDGSVQDMTEQVEWSSSVESTATIGNGAADKGLATSTAMGVTTISATFSGLTGSTTLTVSNATLASIDITPSHPSAALGTTQAFVATGTYTDSTTQDVTDAVTWSTSAPMIATVSNAEGSRGLATTVAVGSTTITATIGDTSGSTVFTVSAAVLVAIAISPDTATLANGTVQQFTALGLLSDGVRQDLTDQVT